MNNKFDDLFNEFFNENSNEKNTKKNNDVERISKILNILSTSKSEENKDTNTIKNIDETLGEPDFIDYYEEDGFFYKKEIWITKMGRVIKKVMSDVPFKKEQSKFLKEKPIVHRLKKDLKIKKPSIPLETLLEEAVSEEDYELAATLRDEIKRRDENSDNQKVKK